MNTKPLEQIWAIVNEEGKVMASTKKNRYFDHNSSNRPLVYASEKNAELAMRQLSLRDQGELRVKRLI